MIVSGKRRALISVPCQYSEQAAIKIPGACTYASYKSSQVLYIDFVAILGSS